jgi:hypothetical protein
MVSSTSTIIDSYVYGFRAPIAINAANGLNEDGTTNPNAATVIIENSTIEGGAMANMHIGSVGNLVFENVTMVQDYEGYLSGNSKVYGMGLYFDNFCRGTITFKGNTRQYNWVSKNESGSFTSVLTSGLSYGCISIGDITIGQMIDKMVDLGSSNGYLHNGYVNTGIVQECAFLGSSSPVNTIVCDEGSGYTGPIYQATSNISFSGLKNYCAWSIPGCSPTCAENCPYGANEYLPTGWVHTTERTNVYDCYLTNREK